MELEKLVLLLLNISILACATPFLILLAEKVFRKLFAKVHRNNELRGVLKISLFLLAAVWCLRYAVGCYLIEYPPKNEEAVLLTRWEEIANSFVHALQTFSMDEDYTTYISTGREMITALYGADSLWINIYSVYASVLNAVAPVFGGAIVFEMLASIFPAFRLRMAYKMIWREKYYFSALNDASLALARSVCATRSIWRSKPVLIFTDAYTNQDNDKSVERLTEAKRLGCICVRDDLAHVPKNWLGRRKFFLIHEEESANLHALADLAKPNNAWFLKKAEICLFVESDAYVQMEQRIKDKMLKKPAIARKLKIRMPFAMEMARWGKLFEALKERRDNWVKKQKARWNKLFKGKEMPQEQPQNPPKPEEPLCWRKLSKKEKKEVKSILQSKYLPVLIPVQRDRNIVSNLLAEVPLYEPLVKKYPNIKDQKELTVAILGSGHIGTEMFLSTYWFGQILDCHLKIQVLSEETEQDFWNKIDYINPEIYRSTQEGDSLLRINERGDMAQPYATVEYTQCNLKASEFVNCLDAGLQSILGADYFMVALGKDEDNISVANTLCRAIGKNRLEQNLSGEKIIAYVVYDSELAKLLNEKQYYGVLETLPDVYMKAVGSLEEVYSVQNVFMSEYNAFAKASHKHYLLQQGRSTRAENHRKRREDDYKFWANMARAMHKKYKFYSMGLIKTSLFDYAKDPEGRQKALEDARKQYQLLVTGKVAMTDAEKEEHRKLLHRVAWLEHRRWNAFTRVKGFRQTTAYDQYAEAREDYKHMELKLHPCLLECDQEGIRAKLRDNGKIVGALKATPEQRKKFDLLDQLSYHLFEKGYNSYDFKIYDYPEKLKDKKSKRKK